MLKHLLSLSTSDLTNLALAFHANRLASPYTLAALQRVLFPETATGIAADLAQLEAAGFTPAQIATTLDLIIQDRHTYPPLDDQLDLVTTGPAAVGVTNRDTGVVVRDLFAGAAESVLIAGYAIYQGQQVFHALADRMQDHPALRVQVFLDIQRPHGDTTTSDDLVRRFAHRFRNQQWPADRPLPELYYDPRSLDLTAEKRTSMHAKCVIVDHHTTFVSSANFTEAAQQRNIEVGLLIRSPTLSLRLAAFFQRLLDQKLFDRVL
jgi:phosphatidylserine/phosphatidylglycerophosphate/cardiolipin synthase-like enzyme